MLSKILCKITSDIVAKSCFVSDWKNQISYDLRWHKQLHLGASFSCSSLFLFLTGERNWAQTCLASLTMSNDTDGGGMTVQMKLKSDIWCECCEAYNSNISKPNGWKISIKWNPRGIRRHIASHPTRPTFRAPFFLFVYLFRCHSLPMKPQKALKSGEY